MKKYLFLIVATALLTVLPAQAGLKWGLKAGMNVSGISTDAKENFDNYTGFQVGPITEFTVPLLGLGFDAALLYSQRGFKAENETEHFGYLEIPVNLKYKFSILHILGAYATVGPYFSYKVTGSDIADDWKDFQTGLNFGLGAEILSKLQIGANYQLGLSDDFKWEEDGKNYSIKNSTWTISLAYFF